MDKENKTKKFWDYALLVVGGILILTPLKSHLAFLLPVSAIMLYTNIIT